LGPFARRALCDRSGATAVEFAIIAMPFLFLLFALLELALVFMVSTTLDGAMNEAARTIRTGAAQAAGVSSKEDFRDVVCARLAWLGSQCEDNLSVDVRTFEEFSDLDAPDPIEKGADGKKVFNEKALQFAPGQADDIVLVRAFYRWPLVSPFLRGGLERLDGGVSVITAAVTFRNEPYSCASPTC
jgi:Flp pilus assembly protein TadG